MTLPGKKDKPNRLLRIPGKKDGNVGQVRGREEAGVKKKRKGKVSEERRA